MIDVKAIVDEYPDVDHVYLATLHPKREFGMLSLETGENAVLLVGNPIRPCSPLPSQMP